MGPKSRILGCLGGVPGGSWAGPGGFRANLRLLGTVLVDLGAVLEPSRTGLGAVLGRLGGLLGRSWALLDSLGGSRGPSWGLLGASRELLGPS